MRWRGRICSAKAGCHTTEILRRGYSFPLVEAFANYKAPARYDDEIELKIWASKIGRTSLRLDYEVTKLPGRELLCIGHTVHVLVGSDGKPTAIPDEFREKFSS